MKRKIYFQDGRYSGHLGFPIRRILAFLIYNSPQYFLPSFKSIGLSVQEKKLKIDFKDGRHGGHLGFPIRTIIAIFYPQVTLMLPIKFQVNWSFGSWLEAKDRFARWLSWQLSRISDRYNFSYFLSTSHPDAFYQVSSQLAFLVQERKRKIDFQDGGHGGFLGFLIGINFSYFWSTSNPNTSYQVLSQWAQVCRRSRLLKQIVDAARWMTHNGPRTMEDGHWLITIAHRVYFVLRWANNHKYLDRQAWANSVDLNQINQQVVKWTW